uniref:Uncharacterized protein n=1 Tax=Rhodnius prolixus TaxID=13249 RepID=T1HPY2_RHOPR
MTFKMQILVLLITVAVICTNSVTALPDGGGNQAYSSNSANIDQI